MRFTVSAFLLIFALGCSGSAAFPDLTSPPGGPAPVFLIDQVDSLEPFCEGETVPRDAAVRVDIIKNSDTAARSITSPLTGAFTWTGTIPPNARLETLIGVGDRPDPLPGLAGFIPSIVRFGPRTEAPPPGVNFRLAADGETIWEQEVGSDDIGKWFAVTIDLSAHAGESVTLGFLTECLLGGSTLPYWGHPAVLAPREKPRRVICIGLDTVAASHVTYMGYMRDTTPNLHELAASATVFNDAHSCSPWTVPAFAAILSGQLPGVTGTDRNNVGISEHEGMIAEVFRRAGFATSSFVNIEHLQEAGFFQGYDHQWEVHDHPAAETLGLAKDWIEKYRDQDFFTFIHLYDPHYPYAPPEAWTAKFRDPNYQGEYMNEWAPEAAMVAEEHLDPATWTGFSEADRVQCVALYDAEIAWMDDAIGEFIRWYRETGLFDDTTIIVLADHGEEFGEHGRWEHGHSQYEEMLRVPFFIKVPGQRNARRIGGLVGTIDLYPTLLELFGLESETQPYGESLVPVLKGGNPDPEHVIVSESMLWGPELKAITGNQYKYILNVQTGAEEFYDLVKDPAETTNLMSAPPEPAAVYGDRLEKYIDDIQSGWHIRFLAGPSRNLPVDLTITSDGSIVNAGIIVQQLNGSGAGLEQPDNSTLRFSLDMLPGDSLLLSFSIDPESDNVTFAGTIDNAPVMSKLRLGGSNLPLADIVSRLNEAGYESELPEGDSLTLSITDPIIALSFPRYNWLEDSGVFLWTVPRELRSHAGTLSDEQKAQLESVGYIFH